MANEAHRARAQTRVLCFGPRTTPASPGVRTARSVAYSRHKPPQTVTGICVDEAAALRNLDDRLHSVPQPNGSRMAERERRIRLVYLDGAEEWSRETTGRRRTSGFVQDMKTAKL